MLPGAKFVMGASRLNGVLQAIRRGLPQLEKDDLVFQIVGRARVDQLEQAAELLANVVALTRDDDDSSVRLSLSQEFRVEATEVRDIEGVQSPPFADSTSENDVVVGADQAKVVNRGDVDGTGSQCRRETAVLGIFVDEQARLAHDLGGPGLWLARRRSNSASSSANSCATSSRLAW